MSHGETLVKQYAALLEVTETIAAHNDLSELFQDLAHKLPPVIKCSAIALALHDPDRNTMRMHILVGSGPVSPEREYPIEDIPGGFVWQHQKPFICNNIDQETRFPKVMPAVRQAGIRSFCTVPLTTAHRRLGAMSVGSVEEHHYEEVDVEFLRQIAKQVAVAVENVGTCGRDRVAPGTALDEVAFRHHREHHEADRDHRVNRAERENGEPDAGARLGVAVDVAPVEQRPQHAATPRLGPRPGAPLGRNLFGVHLRVHPAYLCSVFCSVFFLGLAGKLPVGVVSGFSMIEAMASAACGCTTVGGFSGRPWSGSNCVASAGRS